MGEGANEGEDKEKGKKGGGQVGKEGSDWREETKRKSQGRKGRESSPRPPFWSRIRHRGDTTLGTLTLVVRLRGGGEWEKIKMGPIGTAS